MGSLTVAAAPARSPVHLLDARAKLVAAALVGVALFAAHTLEQQVGLLALVLTVALLASLRAADIAAVIRPLAPLLVVIAVAQLVLGAQPNEQLQQLGPWVVEDPAIARALFLDLRLVSLVVLVTLVTTTTGTTQLAAALEWLLSPLRALRFPVQDIALIVSLAMQLVPLMSQELARLQRAQAARGADRRSLSFRARLQLRTALVVPLLVLAFRRSRRTADAMRLRGYVRGASRTRYREQSVAARDVLALAVAFGCAAIIVVA